MVCIKSPEMLAVLQCTSMYPIHDEDANLAVMDRFANIMDVSIGYSDHTIGSKAIFYAAVKGAEIIEFHFTDIKENRSFRDHQVSLTKKDVLEFIDKLSEFQVLMEYQKRSHYLLKLKIIMLKHLGGRFILQGTLNPVRS